MRALILGLVIAGCGGGDDAVHIACDPPAHTTYACDPMPAGQAGCQGGPTWTMKDGSQVHESPDQSFELNCYATTPECAATFSGGQDYQCVMGDDGTYGWLKLL